MIVRCNQPKTAFEAAVEMQPVRALRPSAELANLPRSPRLIPASLAPELRLRALVRLVELPQGAALGALANQRVGQEDSSKAWVGRRAASRGRQSLELGIVRSYHVRVSAASRCDRRGGVRTRHLSSLLRIQDDETRVRRLTRKTTR